MSIRACVAAVVGDGPVALAIANALESAGATVARSEPGEAPAAAVRRAAAAGSLGILVNCPRDGHPGKVDELGEAEWTASLAAALTATALACRAALGPMRQLGFGRIVNLSDRQYLGAPGNAAFAAAEAGVVSLTRTLALDAARDGITVNCVVPGTIDVGQLAQLPEQERERQRKLHPGGRFGSPDDVAHAVLFFADDESVYITGQTLFVCGGTSIYSSLSV
ncbi:MAG: SDR family oxidoreductase [Chloroflexi bacterium]|nr:SDR family oxidoreductase [Chloroflexota bacterium]